MLYISRFSNPELRSGKYTAVRISIGSPKWPLGYDVIGEIKDLMPWGLLGKYSHEEFVPRYKARLDNIGVDRIDKSLSNFEALGKPVVLLCYEDVRIPGQTCHRTTFAEWWLEKTGEIIEELPDPSVPRSVKVTVTHEEKPVANKSTMPSKTSKASREGSKGTAKIGQISIFDFAV